MGEFTRQSLAEKLGELTERRRRSKGLSIPQQTVQMNIPYTTFVKYLNGKTECSATNCAKIASYYGITCDELLGIECPEEKVMSFVEAADILNISKPVIERNYPPDYYTAFCKAITALEILQKF